MKRRLSIQALENRRLLAGDFCDVSGTSPGWISHDDAAPSLSSFSTAESESDSPQDLVAFAKALTQQGLTLYGADWSVATTEQKTLFADGAKYLDFEEVSNPDRSPSQFALDNGIDAYPTWQRDSDQARLTGIRTLEELATFAGITIPTGESPSFHPVGNQSVRTESPLHLPIDAYNPGGGNLTVTVTVSDPELLTATVIESNRSIRIDMVDYGDMVFELFEQRAPTAAGRVIELAESDFYDDVIFHRVVDEFVIQGGDPTGTGSGGSGLGNFNDDFHPDLQHNRTGVLSFAKGSDDSNNSQFFVTEVPTRFLDFNHSVFGQLVEGESVRESISNHAVNGSDRPTNDIVIDSVDVFNDVENSVVMLKAVGNQTGQTQVTITVTNESGQTATETLTVDVVPDFQNSQPFLDPIIPPRGPAGEPLSLQLSSIDVEGDPVEYLAEVISSDGTIDTVLSPDGLVTITPETDFVGFVDIAVAVRYAEGVQGNGLNDIDIQRFLFEFADPVLFPKVDLTAEDDSGLSDTDNITANTELDFQVSPVVAGDTVQLFIGNVEVAGVIAADSQATLSVVLEPGVYNVHAVVTRDGQELTTAALEVLVDVAAPVLNLDSLPSTAAIGRQLSHTLVSNDDTHVSYELISGPNGASIVDDRLNWLPSQDQLGTQTLQVRLTDRAGNVVDETFDISVFEPTPTDQPLMEIVAVVRNLDGDEVTELELGQPFQLSLIATDLRVELDRDGVYAAFADATFPSSLLTPSGSNPFLVESGFSLTPSGFLSTDSVDEWGAASNDTSTNGESKSIISSVLMVASGTGTATISLDPAEGRGREALLFGSNTAIPIDRINYVTTVIDVVTSWHRELDPTDVNADGETTPRDALAVINLLAVVQDDSQVYQIDRTLFDPVMRYDVVADGVVTPLDALVVINHLALQSSQGELPENSPSIEQQLMDFLGSRDMHEDEEDVWNPELKMTP